MTTGHERLCAPAARGLPAERRRVGLAMAATAASAATAPLASAGPARIADGALPGPTSHYPVPWPQSAYGCLNSPACHQVAGLSSSN